MSSHCLCFEDAPAQSAAPGLGEKYEFPVSSQWALASLAMSFLSVMFGHFCACSRLSSSHFSRPDSLSGLMASTGHAGSNGEQEKPSAKGAWEANEREGAGAEAVASVAGRRGNRIHHSHAEIPLVWQRTEV